MAATLVSAVLGSAALQSTATTKISSVARFNGLRPCPVLRRRATVFRPLAPRRLTITAVVAAPETLTTVQELIAKQLAVSTSKVLPESKFVDLGADSLDTVEIMMAIEEKFEVNLEEDGAEKVTTVQEAADMIQAVIVQKIT